MFFMKRRVGNVIGFSGVQVQVGNSISPKNLYLWHGFWITCTVTCHMCDLPLGHQWQHPTGTTSTTFHSGIPQDEQQHDRKHAMGRMMRAGEGPSCPPPIVWYVSYIFLIFPMWQGGVCPFSLHFCCFNAMRRGIYPSSSCRSSFNTAGRGMPLLVVFLLFQRDEKGHIPLLVVSFLFQHGGKGHAPSPLCLCLIFGALRRGIPLLIAFLLFLCNGEGHPLLIVLFPFQHSKEGHAPSSSCHSHFNTARRDVPSSLCLHFTSDRQQGVCPLSYNLYVN